MVFGDIATPDPDTLGNAVSMEIRLAKQSDIPALFHVRTSVRENHLSREQLDRMGITEASVSGMMAARPCAWVATIDGTVVGFSMIDVEEASLFAAFVLPEHAGKGLGKKLVLAAEHQLFQHHEEIWLETERNSHAVRFYRHLGWGNESDTHGGQIRLTKTRALSQPK